MSSFYERPILDSPYGVLELYNPLDQSGQPLEGGSRRGRRPSRFIVPFPASRKKVSAGQAFFDLGILTTHAATALEPLAGSTLPLIAQLNPGDSSSARP